jgi:TatA/E family protein of Tat protein translocase
MFGLSLGHLLILSVVVLLFGHRRLPELGHALGKGVGAFKNGLEGKGWEDSPPGDGDSQLPKGPQRFQ